MKNKWQKNLLTIGIFLLTTGANAIPKAPCDCETPVVCCEEPSPGPFAFSYPKDMRLSCPKDFYIWAEFLYMQAQEDGLDYGITNNSASVLQGIFPVTSSKTLGFSNDHKSWEWNAGWRVGAGFYLNHDVWAVQAAWTHLNISNHKSTSLDGTSVVLPLWISASPASLTANNADASARWKVKYNVFDLRLGKPFHVSRYLVSHPYFGIRAAWINQHYKAQYSGNFSQSEEPTNLGSNMTGDCDFSGIGSRAGVDTSWEAGGCFNIFGKFSGALLYGSFDIDQQWTGDTPNMNNDMKHDYYTVIPNIEISLGLSWGRHFCCQQYFVTAAIGYEFSYYWNMNNFRQWQDASRPYYNDTKSRGDLMLNGVSFKVGFDF